MAVKGISEMTAEELREKVSYLRDKHPNAMTEAFEELLISCLTPLSRDRSEIRLNIWMLTSILDLRAEVVELKQAHTEGAEAKAKIEAEVGTKEEEEKVAGDELKEAMKRVAERVTKEPGAKTEAKTKAESGS